MKMDGWMVGLVIGLGGWFGDRVRRFGDRVRVRRLVWCWG